jgi:WD40 repeat protein
MGAFCTKSSDSGVAKRKEKKSKYTDDDPSSQTGDQGTTLSSPPTATRSHGFEKYAAVGPLDEPPLCICAGPTTQSFFCGGEDQRIHFRTFPAATKEGQRKGKGTVFARDWKAHQGDVNRMVFHQGSGVLYSASRDKTAKGWSTKALIETMEGGTSTTEEFKPPLLGTFEGHSLNITGLTVSPDGRRLATGSRDNSTRLWDTETFDCLSTQDVKLNIVHWVLWMEGLGAVAQGGEDLTIRLWDFRSSNGNSLSLSKTYGNFDYHPICVTPHTTQDYTIFTGHNGFNGRGCMLLEWDLRIGKAVTQFSGAHTNTVRQVHYSTTLSGFSGKPVLLSTSDDESLCCWDPSPNLDLVGSGKSEDQEDRPRLLKQFRVPEGRVTWLCEPTGNGGDLLLSLRTGSVLGARFQGGSSKAGGFNAESLSLERTMQFGGA